LNNMDTHTIAPLTDDEAASLWRAANAYLEPTAEVIGFRRVGNFSRMQTSGNIILTRYPDSAVTGDRYCCDASAGREWARVNR
jgi:hypothetical protein